MKYAASRIRVALWGSLLLGGAWVAAGPPENERVVPAPVSGMTEVDRINLELNLRGVIARERAKGSPRARIGVYADAGAWHLGARSIVAALEEADVQCRVLDRSLLTTEVLDALARYADGSAAAIARGIEKGEIVLLGAHFERPPPTDGGENAPPTARCRQPVHGATVPPNEFSLIGRS